MALYRIGNVAFGVHKEVARNEHNTLVRPAPGSWRQFRDRPVRDIDADNGEAPVFKLENVRAISKGDGLRSVLMWVRAEPPEEFDIDFKGGNFG